jgi:hypothetical protein
MIVQEALVKLEYFLLHFARLLALSALSESNYNDKESITVEISNLFDELCRVQEWGARHLHIAGVLGAWDEQLNPVKLGLCEGEEIDRVRLAAVLNAFAAEIRETFRNLAGICDSASQYRHWSRAVTNFARSFDEITEKRADKALEFGTKPFDSKAFDINPSKIRLNRGVRRTFVGPDVSLIDERYFVLEYSLEEYLAPSRAGQLTTAVPFFWTLSAREAMVSDSCLLSLVEYDGLPLPFYRDMARQGADEARHAAMYFELSTELMPTYLSIVDRDNKAAQRVRGFLSGSEKLPLPKEGNLYSCMWSASLEQRLALMQVETEGNAVASTRRAIGSRLAREFVCVKRAFEVDYFDEIAHTRIGTRWLRHLFPERRDRREAIENAKLLRGILLLAAFAKSRKVPVEQLANKYLECLKRPTRMYV